jgi:hypothetical protein
VFALLSSPVRRWLLASLLLPVIAFVLGNLGRYLQRRNGGAPTRLSRALLSVSSFTRRHSVRAQRDDADLIASPHPTSLPAATNVAPSQRDEQP